MILDSILFPSLLQIQETLSHMKLINDLITLTSLSIADNTMSLTFFNVMVVSA